MTRTPAPPPGSPTASEEIAEAAASWVARMHDAGCGREAEEQLRAWLASSEDHRRAFQRMERAWARAGEIRLRAGAERAAARGFGRFGWRRAALATGAIAATVIAVILVRGWADDGTTTRVGEQQARVLADGTRVLLNTDTRIEVSYDQRARRVRLVRGEAWFEVSHRPSWPFLVSVDGEEIRALGTSFIVRHDGDHELSVTLVEGRIVVTPVGAGAEMPLQAPQVMAPGQRLTLSERRAPAIDRPELGRIAAWRHGQVDFDETPLREAAAEMNRYSETRVVIADPEIAGLHIGGVFRAGDSDEFVRVVTTAFGLRAQARGHDIVLSRVGATRH